MFSGRDFPRHLAASAAALTLSLFSANDPPMHYNYAMPKQIVFFGSSPFSIIILEKLLADPNAQGSTLCAVVTTPDKPIGRHLKLTPNPVKVLAQKYNIPVFESAKDFIENCKLKIENSVGLVAAYGKLIGPKTLNKLNNQIFGIHPSLLPKYRGPSPLQQQIINGNTETGVTILKIDLGEDTGPIMVQEKDIVSPGDTWITLGNRLFAKGTDLFLLQLHKEVPCKTKKQNNTEATYTRKLTRQDGLVSWDEFNQQLKTNDKLLNQKLRAYAQWPGVWTINPDGKRLKLISLKPKIIVQEEGKLPTSLPPLSSNPH